MNIRRLKRVLLLSIILLAVFCIWVSETKRQHINLSINTTGLSYIICYCDGMGPRRLGFQDNEAVIGDLCKALTGEYDYVRWWMPPGTDGGGLSKICFFDENGNEISTIYYWNGYICKKSILGNAYFLYTHKEHHISFSEIEKSLQGL